MSRLVAIDPAYAKKGRGCACAAFDDGALTVTWYERPYTWTHALRAVADTVVWEIPEVRPREDASPGKANNLIRLAAEGSALAATCVKHGGHVLAVTPTEWKGSTPKPVHHDRIMATLSNRECAVLGTTFLSECMSRVASACRRGALDRWSKPGVAYYGNWDGHNILDAIGIGLWQLKRG